MRRKRYIGREGKKLSLLPEEDVVTGPLPLEENVTVVIGGRRRQGIRLLSSFTDGRNSIAMQKCIGKEGFYIRILLARGFFLSIIDNCEDDYFDEPSEIDSAESANLNGWNEGKPQKPNSIGNWVQCREVMYSDGSDEGIVCGKWRR
ncbi:hypothetical protein GW17_00038596 [Ensete ventricosum]|nr:hypothetical protein GW17_00038596 [Ensete ventricosum]RZR96837.1 hypothetical protein BHM03_00025913 [Ensete ventricosum]